MKFASFFMDGKKYIRPISNQANNGVPFSFLDSWDNYKVNETFSVEQKLYEVLAGKRILLEHIDFPIDVIQNHVENGYLCYEKGLTFIEGKLVCNRCGNEQKESFGEYPCARCLRQCKYCRKCIMMGRVSLCTPLVRWCGPKLEKDQTNYQHMKWEGKLSLGQARASAEVVKAINEKKSLLVWAVCGAGKTEVLFKGIERALVSNKNICIASPRVDVIHELTPRLKKVFPTANIISLFGGSKDRQKKSNFVLATTHQLIHYYNYFDVIVIDEVDAFPYSYDQMLAYGVNNARKEDSSIILLSATPSNELIKTIPTIKIPARYHKSPLPVPSFQWMGNWRKKIEKDQIPPVVVTWVKRRLKSEIPAFLFVPSVSVMKKLKAILIKLDKRIESVHAEDPQRKEKVLKFRDQKIPVLITTTILERGVTVPNLDVAVFAAEEDIYCSSALIQMAGRVGRSADNPSGDVIFFHYGKTKAMKEAKRRIIRMNKEAKRRGLLD